MTTQITQQRSQVLQIAWPSPRLRYAHELSRSERGINATVGAGQEALEWKKPLAHHMLALSCTKIYMSWYYELASVNWSNKQLPDLLETTLN